MITVLFGQPCAGKSTLAFELRHRLFSMHDIKSRIVDGDRVRDIFINKDYSRSGRLRNLERISDIATYLRDMYPDVIVSAVYPYKESRDYMNQLNLNGIAWVHLFYEGERGREKYHVPDFDVPNPCEGGELFLSLNTSKYNIGDCTDRVLEWRKAILNYNKIITKHD